MIFPIHRFKSVDRLIVAAIVAGMILFTGVQASAVESGKVERISGSDRYETSAGICSYGFGSTSEYAIVALGEDFADALCAAPLAGKYGAPILITERNKLNSKIKEQLIRLKVKNAFIIGGTGAVGAGVEAEIKGMGITTTRISGADRYATSVNIASYLDKSGEIVVATGDNFPDALSMAPVAAGKKIPILLTGKDRIPESVEKYIKENKITKTYIVGGTGVISDRVKDMLPNPERLGGSDRYQTNTKVIERFANDLNFNTSYFSTGENFPDSLSGSGVAYRTSSPVILVSPYGSRDTENLVSANLSSIRNIKIFGGYGAVNELSLQGILKEKYAASSSANIGNLGFAAQDGEWIYYNGYDDSNLYKVSADGANKVKLSTDDASFINVKNGWVYYSNGSDGNKLYKIRTDGSGRSKVSETGALYIYVMEDYIYYINASDPGSLYKIKTDGTGGKKIVTLVDNGVAGDVIIDGQYIYYTNISELSTNVVRIDGTGRRKLNSGMASGLVKIGDWIYYMDHLDSNKMYKIRTDGTGRTLVINASVIGLNYNDGYLYNSVTTDLEDPKAGKGGLYRTEISTGQSKLLTFDIPYGINVVDEWVYFMNLSDGGRIYRVKTDGTSKEFANTDAYRDKEVNTLGISGGNAVNAGLATSQGDWIYYIQGWELFRMKKDGNSRSLVYKDTIVNYLNLEGDFIYFTIYSPVGSQSNRIHRMRRDGSGLAKLNDVSSKNMIVKDGWIYYANSDSGNRIYRMRTDGTENTMLNSKYALFEFNIAGDYIYYNCGTGDGSLGRMKIDGSEDRVLINNFKAKSINIVGEYVYYSANEINKYGIYRSKIDGSSVTAISTDNAAGIVVQDDWIYYNKFADGLYRMKTDGTDVVRLTYDYAHDFSICDDWIIHKRTSGSYKDRISTLIK